MKNIVWPVTGNPFYYVGSPFVTHYVTLFGANKVLLNNSDTFRTVLSNLDSTRGVIIVLSPAATTILSCLGGSSQHTGQGRAARRAARPPSSSAPPPIPPPVLVAPSPATWRVACRGQPSWMSLERVTLSSHHYYSRTALRQYGSGSQCRAAGRGALPGRRRPGWRRAT